MIYPNQSGKAISNGEKVTIECTASASPPAKFTIYRDKTIILNMAPVGIYVISSFSAKDRGNYSCKVQNVMGSVVAVGLSLKPARKNMINTFLCLLN